MAASQRVFCESIPYVRSLVNAFGAHHPPVHPFYRYVLSTDTSFLPKHPSLVSLQRSVAEFQSTHHPGSASAVRVYGEALVGPIGACMLPLMIMATVQVLEKVDPLPYVATLTPVALVIAVTWTRFRLGARIAELHTYPGMAAIRSIDDVVHNRSLDWRPVFDVRETPDRIHVTMGHETHTFLDAQWPGHDDLLEALRSSRYDRTDQPPPARSSFATDEEAYSHEAVSSSLSTREP